MKKLNKTLSLILAVLMIISIIPLTASAATIKYAGDSVYWLVENGTLMIYGSGEMYSYTSSTVPWRSYKDKIKEISIDEDITSIGDYAFYGLNITKVEIPEGIRKIGTCAFANCTSLSEVVIRKGVEIIDSDAFANCTSLNNVYYYSPQNDWGLINIRTGNNYLLNAELFVNGNGKITWEYEQETGTLTFSGNGVIQDYYIDSEDRFLKQPWSDIEKDIKHLVFNEGITSIGKYAFAHCTSLETVTMSSVELIGGSAFYDCPVLKEITIGNSLKVIENGAFDDCKKLTYIYFMGTQEEWDNISIGRFNDEMETVKVYPSDYAVYSDYGTYQSVFGGNIFSWVFDAYSSTLTISGEGDLNWVFSLPWAEYQYDIKRIVFSEGITSICSIVFDVHPNIEEIVIPASVTSIAKQAFSSEFLTDVYYTGTEAQWNNIAIGENNDTLLNATIHYNYVECVHNFETSIVKAPTCSRIGYTTRICSICNGSIVDDIVECLPHPYATVVTAPTCSTRGYTTYTCPDCGDIKDDDYVDATGHNFKKSSTVSPTCTESGYIKHICINCGNIKKEITESALGHDYSTAVTFEPTCTAKGYTTQTCVRCLNAKKYDYVDALGHDYVLTSTAAPTCTAKGCAFYKCSHCDVTKTEYYADAKGHNYEWTITVEPTCTVDGTQIGICIECGAETTGGVSRLGHDWSDEYVVDYAPTCTKDGQESRHCSRCDWKLNAKPIPAGHTFGEWEQVDDAKCGEYGRFERFCSLCGQINIMSAPADHDYSIEKNIVEASCTTEGSKTLECSCGVTKTETIPATGHNHEPVVTAPTCTEQGYTTYICKCGDSYIVDYVDALGHTSANAVEENYVVPTCTENGSKDAVVYCSVCEEEISRETVEIDATGHSYTSVVTPPTCSEQGYTTYTCECGDTYVDDYVNATGHADNDGDGYCDACDELLDPTVECECNCHKDGISGFFWNIKIFFSKLFRTNKMCECGVAHY